MKKAITALIDYKGKFGSKHFDNPYRSGMDKTLLTRYFTEKGYEIEFIYFHDVDLRDDSYIDCNILYTSSEDIGYHYKSYIEDIVFGLHEKGANVIPGYKYLRANNNKAFMEALRDVYLKDCSLKAVSFGSLKDLLIKIKDIDYPLVLKPAEGASGTGVSLVKNRNELVKGVKRFKDYSYLKEDIKDYLRPFIHKGYERESVYRSKFILQNFIPNLRNDWKVYIFGTKYYIFKRPIMKGRGIKASGGGYDNYSYGENAGFPDGIFDFCENIFTKLNLPHLSVDIAYDGEKFYLIEFQGLYFGTAGIPYSKGYFNKKGINWEFIKEKLNVEQVYVDSIIYYLKRESPFYK